MVGIQPFKRRRLNADCTEARRRVQSSPSDVIIDCLPTTTASTLNL